MLPLLSCGVLICLYAKVAMSLYSNMVVVHEIHKVMAFGQNGPSASL